MITTIIIVTMNNNNNNKLINNKRNNNDQKTTIEKETFLELEISEKCVLKINQNYNRSFSLIVS